jgi:hypothetical protein
LSPAESVYVPEPMREMVASDKPTIRPSVLFDTPRRAAARNAALVTTAFRVAAAGRTAGRAIDGLLSEEIIYHERFLRKKRYERL